MKKELDILRKMLNEAGLKSNEEFYRNPYNRVAIHKENPRAFLTVDRKKIPRFPVCDKNHNYSVPIVKRSLMSAQRLERTHGPEKYKSIIEKLNAILQSLSNKATLKPAKHGISGTVQNILAGTRTLGKLGE
ncbi:MAG: hypothetical protein KAS32_29675 [Candidatus Peribacteraceae bacterium]|nr:hypothetical protein [Candidatus Peribacteraceae bacterium]